VNKDKINILLVDDEALVRQGLRSLLEKEPFVGGIFEASDGNECTTQAKENNIDIVLMDIRLRAATGVELINNMKEQYDRLKIIAVTGMEGIELMINLLKSGVDGIVYKLDGYDEIRKTIKSVLTPGNYFPEKILRIIQVNATRWDNIPSVILSTQEMDILKSIAKGSVTKEIAKELKMTEATAETYRLRLLKKVGVPNTAALIAYAFRNGLL
jgi:DNA-binding NarL/FixJ family response regulator